MLKLPGNHRAGFQVSVICSVGDLFHAIGNSATWISATDQARFSVQEGTHDLVVPVLHI